VSRRLKLALALLTVMHIPIIFAGFFAPYDPTEQHRSHSYAPPTRLHFVDDQGGFHLRPFVYPWVAQDRGGFVEDRSHAFELLILEKVQGPIGSSLPRWRLFTVEEPGRIFLLGTDYVGRDVYSRLLHGGRVSLSAGIVATFLSLCIGFLLGGTSGYFGGRFDDLVMRLTEVFMALPWLYLLLAVRAFLPLSLSPVQTFLLLIAIIGVINWSRPARLIRGVVLSTKERDYVQAARGFGASHLYLLRRHIMPATFGVVLTQATLLVPQYILAEVTLSFLGLGAGEPTPSWGAMLATLRQYHVAFAYWWMLSPGVALIVAILCYHRVAGALPGLNRRAVD
jgi:peptide/nickel transport system permease protein